MDNKWPGITINTPVATLMRTSINLVTKQIYNIGIVKCNPWCTYSPLVPKWDTFMLLTVHLCWIFVTLGSIWKCHFHKMDKLPIVKNHCQSPYVVCTVMCKLLSLYDREHCVVTIPYKTKPEICIHLYLCVRGICNCFKSIHSIY